MAVKLDPNVADHYNNLGIAYAKSEDFISSKEAFDTCLKLNPFHKGGQNNLNQLKEFAPELF